MPTQTVTYSKLVSDGNYGNEGISLTFEFETPATMGYADVEKAMIGAWENLRFAADEALALGQVEHIVAAAPGEPYIEDDRDEWDVPIADSVEEVVNQFTTPSAAPIVDAPRVEDEDPFTFIRRVSALGGAAQQAALLARLASHPDEFWDNREKKAAGEYKPNSPDFKWGKGRDAGDIVKGDRDLGLPIWPAKN